MNFENNLDLNKYELLKNIGNGSYATVFSIKEKSTGNIFAAKIINKKYEIEKEESNEIIDLNLRREKEIISKLSHPCVLKFIGYSLYDFNNERKLTFVSEYISNGSLSNIIKKQQNGLSPESYDDTQKLIIIYGIASGMSYLHSLNIIHRDLKPENILLDELLYPKISDFGFSKIKHSNLASQTVQSSNHVLGSPIYMAPESFSGKDQSKPVDVYSFAMIVYEMYNHERPFKDLVLCQIIGQLVNSLRPPIDDDVPSSYRELIEDCWDQEPDNRPTFDAILERLKNKHDFITDQIDEEKFFNYVEYIDSFNKKKQY